MRIAVAAVLGIALSAATAQAAGIDVIGWMERDGAKRELVLSFTPRGGAKLVADPGIALEPLPGRIGPTFEYVEPDRSYFEAPLWLRVPVDAKVGERIGTRVNYAYCIVEYQCLFGEAVIELTVPPG